MNAPLQFSVVSAEHPFPGLRPFAYQDHEYFFGREDQTYALYRLIDRFHLLRLLEAPAAESPRWFVLGFCRCSIPKRAKPAAETGCGPKCVPATRRCSG